MAMSAAEQESYGRCGLCPRACGVDRTAGRRGVCGAGTELKLGRVALHWWEEPCLVGEQGSGAVFFSHCPLGCVYCQNRDLAAGAGVEVGEERFERAVLRLQNEEGAANINLVTPTHYVPTVAKVLGRLRESGALRVPVVYNTSSYDSLAALRMMDGVVDVYLADCKYASAEPGRRFSRTPDYAQAALAALHEMVRQAGEWTEDADGMLQRGVIVRHLVLPGMVDESLRVLEVMHREFGGAVRLSIMNQFTPLSGDLERYGLSGTVSAEDYERVLDYADALGIEDYFWQEGGAAQESFIPAFDGTGV